MTLPFSLGRIERTRPHLLADTAELALLYSGFDQISEADLLTIIRQNPKAGKELLEIDEPDLDDDGEADDLGGARINEREQAYIEECFRQIEFRASAFGEAYPFELREGILYEKLGRTAEIVAYVFLLVCSRTRSFGSRAITQRLSEEFEEISAAALANMVNPRSTIIQFGAAPRQRGGVFSSNLIEAIPQLAEVMGCRLGKNWQKNLNPQGDGRIDLVAVYPFDPYSEGYHVIIGQCASMEDESSWQKKRQEAQMTSMRGFFSPLVDAQAALFIPVCFREADGSWISDNDVSDVIPMDRLRIMMVLEHGDASFDAEAALQRAFG